MLDTNTVLSGLLWSGAPAKLIDVPRPKPTSLSPATGICFPSQPFRVFSSLPLPRHWSASPQGRNNSGMRRAQGQEDEIAVHRHRGRSLEAPLLPRKDRSRQAEKPRRAGATRQVRRQGSCRTIKYRPPPLVLFDPLVLFSRFVITGTGRTRRSTTGGMEIIFLQVCRPDPVAHMESFRTTR